MVPVENKVTTDTLREVFRSMGSESNGSGLATSFAIY